MAEFKRGSEVLRKDAKGGEVEARVIAYRPSSNLYNIELRSGTTELVKPEDIALNPKVDQHRRSAKSSSPSRSRGRQRSRTRSPGRGGARKSPAPNRRSAPAARLDKSETDGKAAKPEKAAAAAVVAAVVEKKDTGKAEASGSTLTRRKSTRLAAKEDEAKVVKKSPDAASKVVAAPGKVSTATWLAILGALICTVSIPATFVGVNMMCDKKNCTLRMLSMPKRLATFYDRNAWLAYGGFAALQAILLLLPIGKRIEGPSTAAGRNYYRYNGWASMLVTLGALFGLERYGVPIGIIRAKFFALMAAAWVFGTALSIVVYVKTRLSPGKNVFFRGQTGNAFVDWHAGRETIPRLGKYFDLKLYGVRLSANGVAVMVAGLCFLAYRKAEGHLPYQLYVCAALGLFYILDFNLRENDYLTTYDYLKTGAGYTFFSCAALYPFLFSLPMRFLHDQVEHKLLVELHTSVLAGIVCLFLVGYLVYLISNRIKNAFRRDPNSKRFTDLEIIPTSKGKALIVSAPWGWVRRPNYVGDLIMSVCMASTTGFGHFMPFICPLGMLVMFVLRAYDDESRLKQRYGSAWTRYCQRVPYRFIPKVY